MGREQQGGAMSSDDLKKSLIGCWRLLSMHLKTSDGKVSYPFGSDALGYYIFSESGYMSVNIMPVNRPKSGSGDVLCWSVEEKVKAAETYISYSGKYEIQGDKLIVHPEVVFFQNWVGVDQVRTLELSGNQMTLSSPPMLASGIEQTAHLVWERI
ncbi:MAG: lipocalin-like domain-containing protein [Thermodesulfobacteriota bacterium]|nr:lipocalin-like domain-containing protein [Thermodesulfobacteriota bacterium]